MAWMREVRKAEQLVNNELSSLADMLRKYNHDEGKDDKGNKGPGGKKRTQKKAKKTLMPLRMCFKSPGALDGQLSGDMKAEKQKANAEAEDRKAKATLASAIFHVISA